MLMEINTVKSHNIEKDLVQYGELYWGKTFNPSTYSRTWRKLKEHNVINELDVKVITINERPEPKWILKSLMD